MLDRPESHDLLASVSETLKGLIEALPPRQQFELRVALSALGIVRRELAMGPALTQAEQKRLAALLGHDGEIDALNAELCDRLREGAIDLTTPGISDHLWHTTLDKLSVDQPKYPTYRRLLDGEKPKKG